MDRAITKGEYKPEHILHEIEEAEGREVTVIVGIPSSGAAIASLIGRDDMEPSGRERHHDLPPAVGEFRKPVKEDDTRTVSAFEARFQRVNTQAVVVVHEP
jgi:orotate phosphoribosyltransferase-like protein